MDFGAHETEATIIEMNPSTYNVRMFAKNSQATSAASNVLTITTGEAGVIFIKKMYYCSCSCVFVQFISQNRAAFPICCGSLMNRKLFPRVKAEEGIFVHILLSCPKI